MARVLFEVPDDLTKELSENTKKVYKTRLNKLAVAGFETKNDLIKKQKDVINLIKERTGGKDDNDENRMERRMFLSAIFWVLNEEPLKNKKKYYDFFQVSKQNYGKKE